MARVRVAEALRIDTHFKFKLVSALRFGAPPRRVGSLRAPSESDDSNFVRVGIL